MSNYYHYKESDEELPKLNRIIKDKDPAKILIFVNQGGLRITTQMSITLRIGMGITTSRVTKCSTTQKLDFLQDRQHS